MHILELDSSPFDKREDCVNTIFMYCYNGVKLHSAFFM